MMERASLLKIGKTLPSVIATLSFDDVRLVDLSLESYQLIF